MVNMPHSKLSILYFVQHLLGIARFDVGERDQSASEAVQVH